MYDFSENLVSTMQVSVEKNSAGNIAQEGETVAGVENFTFKGFASSLSAAEVVNDENSPALHNGVAGFVWLFTGRDDNFDPTSVQKTTKAAIDYE